MYEYMTRAMVALKPVTYAGNEIKVGDTFTATPDDAGYLTRCKIAAPVEPEVGIPFPDVEAMVEARVHSAVGAMQADPAGVDNQGSPDVELVAEVAPSAAESEAAAEDQAASEIAFDAAEAVEVTQRRRGRARKSVE
jgi:hypothetical protein